MRLDVWFTNDLKTKKIYIKLAYHIVVCPIVVVVIVQEYSKNHQVTFIFWNRPVLILNVWTENWESRWFFDVFKNTWGYEYG